MEYYEELQNKIVELKFQKTSNKELAMPDAQRSYKRLQYYRKRQMEHDRFGYEAPNYQANISNFL
ncbi:hypothetical protein ACHRVZ_08290 [Flavobacterium sp. FlaQc-57]|uniref:hypothetical protein n=1 Tax=Flavobacterium sp. FlaQc-57 TaxID=3374186 RepID=UPI0037565853